MSLAIFAITGAAPVPVPPPIPAVTKSIFVPIKHFADLLFAFKGSIFPYFRIRAAAESFGKVRTNLKFVWNRAVAKRLIIRVAHNKLNIFDALFIHVVHGITSSPAYADHLDDGLQVIGFGDLKFVGSSFKHDYFFKWLFNRLN